MMINFNSYFSSGSAYSSKEFLIFYSAFVWFLVLCNLLLFLKMLYTKQSDMKNKNLVVIILFWLNVWNYGELILVNVQLFSNLNLIIFADLDNIFLPFGLSLSILYFSRYLQSQLQINKYSTRINSISSQIVTVAFYFTFIPLLILLGRFLLIQFLSVQVKDDIDVLIEIIILILAFFVLILLLLAIFQLHQERNFVSSKVDRYRVRYYEYFIISLLLYLIFIILNLTSGLIFTFPRIVNDLIAIPVYLGSFTGALSLYTAYVLPEWVQRRAGLLASFR